MVFKKKTGRPQTDYKSRLPKDWQDIILNLCALGKSDVQIRAYFCMMGGKFNHDMWYALKERDAEFSETIIKGKVLCESWWIDQGQNNLTNPKFQTFLWFTNMKNRFSDHWKDRTQNTNLNMNGTPDDAAFCDQFFGFNRNGNGKHGNNGHGGNGEHGGNGKAH